MWKISVVTLASITCVLLLVSCGAELTPTATPEPPSAVEVARQMLSEDFDVPVGNIELVTYTIEDWPDACLGLPNADELCAQVVTPGYRVVLKADGEQYVYRTDETGQVVRQEF